MPAALPESERSTSPTRSDSSPVPPISAAVAAGVGNAALARFLAPPARRILARYATADEMAEDLRRHPVADLAEAYSFLNGRNIIDIVRSVHRLGAAVRDRLETEVLGARGVNVPRLRLAFAFTRAADGGIDPVTFFHAHRGQLRDLSAIERREMFEILAMFPAPLERFTGFRGFTALPAAAQQRIRASVSPLALNDAFVRAMGTDSEADDPDHPEFFERLFSEHLPWHPDPIGPDARAEPVAVVGPQPAAPHVGPNETYAAHEWFIAVPVRGATPGTVQIVRVYLPVAPAPAGRRYPSVRGIADRLSRLPAESLRNIHTISIEPHMASGHPDWGASDDASGDMSYYPQEAGEGSRQMTVTLAHETGHTLSFRHWGGDFAGPRWQPWRDAIAADGLSVSGYGRTSVEDDFAESFALYMGVHGQAGEAEVRRMYPRRWALIDQLLIEDDKGTSRVSEHAQLPRQSVASPP
jgi:hypothetical protein